MAPTDNVVGNPLVVSTAHIHWDPEFCDVKLIQSMMLVQEINTLLDEVRFFFEGLNLVFVFWFTQKRYFLSSRYRKDVVLHLNRYQF